MLSKNQFISGPNRNSGLRSRRYSYRHMPSSSSNRHDLPRSFAVVFVVLAIVVMAAVVMMVSSGGGVDAAVIIKSNPPPLPSSILSTKTTWNEDTKHPMEDIRSWRLHLERRTEQQAFQSSMQSNSRRRLATYVKVEQVDGDVDGDGDGDGRTPYTVLHKKLKPHLPFAGGDTTHGMMIDAGSQGTLHTL